MKWLIAVALVLVCGQEVFGRQHVIKGTLSMKGEEPVVPIQIPLVEESVVDTAFTCPPMVPCPVQEVKEMTCNCPEQKTCPLVKECETIICPKCPACARCPIPSKLSNCDSWKYAFGGTSMLVIALAVSIVAMLGKATSDTKGGKTDKNTKILLLEKDDIIATQQQKITKLTSDLAAEKNHNDNVTKKAKTAAVTAAKPTVVTVDHTERDALQQQLRDLQTKNQQEKTKMDSQIRQLEKDKTELKNQLKKLSESMGIKEKEITDFNTQIKKQKEQMKEKDKEVTDSVQKLKEQIDKLKTEVVEKTKHIGEKTTELHGMTEKMGVKDKEMIKKNKEINDLLAQVEKGKEELARASLERTDSIKETPSSDGIASSNEDDGRSNMNMINTELTAQLMNLTKEFASYKESADKIIADLEARMTSEGSSGVNTPAGSNSPTTKLKSQFALEQKERGNGGGKGIRSRSPASDVKRGATRLAKLGLEDLDEVAALKKQLADLQEKSNLLAAHLQHAKFLASRAVHTTAELQAQNLEVKQELLSISSEFELYKENCTLTLAEYEKKHIKDGEAMAALRLELKEANMMIEELRSQLAAKEISQDKSTDRSMGIAVSQEVSDRDERGRDELINQLKDQLAALIAEYQGFKTTAGETLALSNTKLQTVQREYNDHLSGCQDRMSSTLDKEYQTYKTTSEKTLSDLNVNHVKVKEDYAQHLKECKLAAEKAAKSIADLEGANKQLKDQMAAFVKEYQTYKITSEKTIMDLENRQKEDAKTIEQLKSQSNKDAETVSETMIALALSNKRVSELEGQLLSLTISEKACESELEVKLAALTAEYQAYTTRSEATIKELTMQVSSLELLQKQVVEVTKLRDILMEEKQILLVNYDDLSKELEALRSDHDQLQDDTRTTIDTYKDEKAMLNKLIAENTREIKALLPYKSELNTVKSQLTASNTDLAETKDQLLTLALEFQTYKGKADQHISNLEQLLKSKEQRQAIQGGHAEQRIAELEAQLASDSKNAVNEYTALMKKLAETMAAASTSNSLSQQRISDLEKQLEKKELDDKEAMSKLQKRIAELESQLSTTKDQMMGLAEEYMAYKHATGEKNNEKQASTTNNDVLQQQRLTDLQRQYTLLEAQNAEMRRKLWNLEKTADNDEKKEAVMATKDPLTASRDIDLQSTYSENAENHSLLSATAEDYNQTEFASAASVPSSSLKSRQPGSTSTQSTIYDLRRNGTSTVGSVTGTSSSSSVGSGTGMNVLTPTPNNTPAKSTVSSAATDPIGSFFNMFGHGSG